MQNGNDTYYMEYQEECRHGRWYFVASG
jgi:hypothetical protein